MALVREILRNCLLINFRPSSGLTMWIDAFGTPDTHPGAEKLARSLNRCISTSSTTRFCLCRVNAFSRIPSLICINFGTYDHIADKTKEWTPFVFIHFNKLFLNKCSALSQTKVDSIDEILKKKVRAHMMHTFFSMNLIGEVNLRPCLSFSLGWRPTA